MDFEIYENFTNVIRFVECVHQAKNSVFHKYLSKSYLHTTCIKRQVFFIHLGLKVSSTNRFHVIGLRNHDLVLIEFSYPSHTL